MNILNKSRAVACAFQIYSRSQFHYHGVLTCAISKGRHKFGGLVSSPANHLIYVQTQNYCSEVSESDIKNSIEVISEQFSEAMELIEEARSSVGTVYFSDDVRDAQVMVDATILNYNNLLSRLSEDQRLSVIQSIGLKMEELKAQMDLLEELSKQNQ